MKVISNKEYIIGSQNLGVQITTEGINIEQLWQEVVENPLLQRFIPNLAFNGKELLQLRVINSKSKNAQLDQNVGLLQGIYKKDFSSTDVIVMAEYLLERKRQEKGIYTIHSTAIYKNDVGMLLVGNLTGAGKTSTALTMHNSFGFGIYSDEKTQIDSQLNLVGQVNKIILEYKTKKTLGSLSNASNNEFEIDKVVDKKLSIIIIPIVIESAVTPTIIKYSQAQIKWLLYEELSKDIRLVNGLVHTFSYPVMSQDSFEIAQAREQLSEEISKKIPVFLVKGQLNQIVETINQLFEEHL